MKEAVVFSLVTMDCGGECEEGISACSSNVCEQVSFNCNSRTKLAKDGQLNAKRRTYQCDSCVGFKKTIVILKMSKKQFPLSFLRYYTDGNRTPVFKVNAHGNSKDKMVPYYRTAESIKELCKNTPGLAKRAFFGVRKTLGGITSSPVGFLPKNKRQIKYLKKKDEPIKSKDPMLSVKKMIQGDYGHFIREFALENTSPRYISEHYVKK
uniref:Uncharacterized protein n=1 Tax=Strigamia maritima TaxID=126957 RepID=T1JJK3_STRMM